MADYIVLFLIFSYTGLGAYQSIKAPGDAAAVKAAKAVPVAAAAVPDIVLPALRQRERSR